MASEHDAILRARTFRSGGDLTAAAAWYAKALALDAGSVEILRELGETHLERGAFADAIGALSQAAAIAPHDPAVSFYLALALLRADRVEDALAELDRAEQLAPGELNLLRLKFSALHAACDEKGAREVGLRLLASDGSDAKTVREMLPLAKGPEEQQRVRSLLEIICRSTPSDILSWRALARDAYNAGDYDRSMAIFDEGLAQHDDAVLRLVRALTLPKIARSVDEISRVRESLDAQCTALIEGGYRIPNILKSVGMTAFHLAYHGLDDRPLQEKIARAHLAVTPSLAWTSPHCAAKRTPGSKIRIGFISRYFTRHAVGEMLSGIIRSLSQSRFETLLIHVQDQQDDFTELLNREVSGSITLPRSLEAAREAISQLSLDVLFYADIGMDPFTYYLAFSRLARVQAVWPGHPVTTGIPGMDVYISSMPAEPEDAQDHYTERLVRLRRLPIFGQPRYGKPLSVNFDFPRGKRIYACPNSIYKFHPTFDRLLGRILDADPNGILTVVGGTEGWYKTLIDRMGNTIPGLDARLITLPWLKRREFFSLLRAADAILDTTHFSGGNTSLDGFSCGVAPVTLEGRFLRSRSTTGMYRQMGLPSSPTQTEADYVNCAVRTANDPAFRTEAGRQILERLERLFDDRIVLEELENHFAELVAAA